MAPVDRHGALLAPSTMDEPILNRTAFEVLSRRDVRTVDPAHRAGTTPALPAVAGTWRSVRCLAIMRAMAWSVAMASWLPTAGLAPARRVTVAGATSARRGSGNVTTCSTHGCRIHVGNGRCRRRCDRWRKPAMVTQEACLAPTHVQERGHLAERWLLHRYALGEVARLVDVPAEPYGGFICQQLHGYGEQHG